METKIIRAALAAICAAAAFAEEPYAFVDYVESTGSQYIDTEIVGRCSTRADMTIRWMQSGVDASFLSSRVDGNATRFILCSNNKYNEYYCGHRDYDTYSSHYYNSSGTDRIECSITSNSASSVTVKMTINGIVAINKTKSATPLNTGRTMYIFAQNQGGSAVLKSKVRCYALKIWQDEVLVRNFRPCVKRDGTAGLYDTVTKRIFTPVGGALTADTTHLVRTKPDHFVQYVESNGSQYIDTGVVGRCNTGADMTIQWLSQPDGSFLSSRVDSGNTRFILCSNDKNKKYYAAHRTIAYCSEAYTYKTTGPDHIVSSLTSNATSVVISMNINKSQALNVTHSSEAPLNTELTMYLFAQNNGGNVDLKSSVRCFGVKITQDGALARDFLPCIKDGKAGLYDVANGWIFFARGGNLAYPNETPDKYVRWANVTGSSYVPVAVRGKSGIRAEMKYMPTDDSRHDQYFLAARVSDSTNTRFLLNYLNHKAGSPLWNTVGYLETWNCAAWNWVAGGTYTLVSEIAANGAVNGTLNGVSKPTVNKGTFDTGLDLYMFAINMGGNAQDYYKGRFYYTAIDVYDETAGAYRQVRNFRPCVKGGNVMFYDEVSKTMFKPYPAISAVGNVCRTGVMIMAK